MQVLEGVVIVVQEGRFLLLTDSGKGHLLILAHNAAAETAQLQRLQREQARVRVHCRTAPGLIAWTAHSVEVSEAHVDHD